MDFLELSLCVAAVCIKPFQSAYLADFVFEFPVFSGEACSIGKPMTRDADADVNFSGTGFHNYLVTSRYGTQPQRKILKFYIQPVQEFRRLSYTRLNESLSTE